MTATFNASKAEPNSQVNTLVSNIVSNLGSNLRDAGNNYVTDVLTPMAAAAWPLVSAASLSVPGIHRDLLHKSMEASPGWRYPLYDQWFAKSSYLQQIDSQGQGRELSGLQKFVTQPLLPYLPATYIEWRYYSIISTQFQGIVGVSLFNPKNKFSRWAEGGLLVLVAGVLDSPANVEQLRADAQNNNLKEVCWQKLFPTSCLKFSGPENQHLVALHEGIELSIQQIDIHISHVTLKGEGAPMIDLVHTGLEKTSIFPAPAEDLKRVPGAHWIVHNPSPIASVDGSIHFSQKLVQNMPVQGLRNYPAFVSRQLQTTIAKSGHLAQFQKANGYYEHSFGMNPMPLHGWDFVFAPDAANKAGLVMQTYQKSQEICFVEVFWKEQGEQKYTRFNHQEFSLKWAKSAWCEDIRATLPKVRTIHGHKSGYTLEVKNEVITQLPFLRRNTAVVRNFFISEEISVTSWSLKDAQGNVVASATQLPSGGETAFARLSR